MPLIKNGLIVDIDFRTELQRADELEICHFYKKFGTWGEG